MRSRAGADGAALLAITAGTVLGTLLMPVPFPHAGPTEPDPAVTRPEPAPPPSATTPSAITPSDAVAFHASSFGSEWSLEGDYAGSLRWDGRTLTLDLTVATVRAQSGEEPVHHLSGVRLALAEDTPDGWRVVREGPLLPLGADISEGSRLTLEGVRLSILDISEDDLVGRWLVVVHELQAPGSTPTWTYAHADPDLIPRLLEWGEDGS